MSVKLIQESSIYGKNILDGSTAHFITREMEDTLYNYINVL
jgi:hypothetical protein